VTGSLEEVLPALQPGITVVTPTIPPRAIIQAAQRESVLASMKYLADRRSEFPSLPGALLRYLAVPDLGHAGAAKTRHAGLMQVDTEWVAFFDDDDEMLPAHLYALFSAALEHDADYVWSRFRIVYPDGTGLDGPAFLGEKAFSQWNDEDPCQTTITTLVRTELAREAGGFAQFEEDGREVDGQRRGEDHEFTLRCRKAGGVFRHVPEVTWLWHHWGVGARGVPGNTSGMPDRW
jgi:hypothetical protein